MRGPAPQPRGARGALAGKNIAQYAGQPIDALKKLLREHFPKNREAEIARDIVAELNSRLGFLGEVGLGYLTLDRSAPTLSGGEAQRIRLAAQLGSNLRGVCYILDEPTIGLHHRDNRILLDVLEKLEAKGNSLVVVEHDEDTIRRAQHVVDLGPGAGRARRGRGRRGRRRGADGEPRLDHRAIPQGASSTRCSGAERLKGEGSLDIQRASLHNLKNIDVCIPLGRLVAVTGVSGSGKSTLARDVLYESFVEKAAGLQHGRERSARPGSGPDADRQDAALLPRDLRRLLGLDPQALRRHRRARVRGWSASRFSFNTAGGRCAECEGQGLKKIEMSFLPDVRVMCEACGGARFNPETLQVRLRGKTVGEVLAMSVDEAVEFFAAHPSIHRCLRLLQDVGLGYLTLGQQSPTLSGGEAQRIKLVYELSKTNAAHAYVLDEPPSACMADVEKLIRVLHRLVDAGNTAVVIEHNPTSSPKPTGSSTSPRAAMAAASWFSRARPKT